MGGRRRQPALPAMRSISARAARARGLPRNDKGPRFQRALAHTHTEMKEDAPRIGERIGGLELSVAALIHPSIALRSGVTGLETTQARASVADE
jgi:hypothetical protein